MLIRNYLFGESLREIAEGEKVTFQAISQRIIRAARRAQTDLNLLKCIGRHWRELRITGKYFH